MTISQAGRLAQNGVACSFSVNECITITELDEQKLVGKDIFGRGLLLSEKSTQKRIEAEREANENYIEKKGLKKVWNLSNREKQIQKMLDK